MPVGAQPQQHEAQEQGPAPEQLTQTCSWSISQLVQCGGCAPCERAERFRTSQTPGGLQRLGHLSAPPAAGSLRAPAQQTVLSPGPPSPGRPRLQNSQRISARLIGLQALLKRQLPPRPKVCTCNLFYLALPSKALCVPLQVRLLHRTQRQSEARYSACGMSPRRRCLQSQHTCLLNFEVAAFPRIRQLPYDVGHPPREYPLLLLFPNTSALVSVIAAAITAAQCNTPA